MLHGHANGPLHRPPRSIGVVTIWSQGLLAGTKLFLVSSGDSGGDAVVFVTPSTSPELVRVITGHLLGWRRAVEAAGDVAG